MDIVSVHVQPRGIVCAGLCPSFKIDVSDGWLTGIYDILPDQDAKPVQYRITHAQYLAFRARLGGFRPVEGQSAERSCENDDDGYHGAPYELTWFGEGRTVHRNACGGTEEDHAMFCAMLEALYAVDFDPLAGGRLKRRGDVPQILEAMRCERAS